MSIDSMRVGGGRCPPLLVGGLFVICLMLVINWYSLSSENLELLRQVEELEKLLKISAEERDQCVTRSEHLEQVKKKNAEEIVSLNFRITDSNSQQANVEMSLTACKTELTSLKGVDETKSATIDALRLDKDRTSTQLDEKREENKKLQEELAKVKSELETAKAAINAPAEKKVVKILPKTQTNTKLKNNANIDGGGQDLQEEEDEIKEQMNNMIQGNPLEDTEDAAEFNNVGDEDKDQQKLATNDQEKQQDPSRQGS